jgi:hypothetical protein
MKKQLNFQQQNAETKAAIVVVASRYASQDPYTNWVAEALLKSGLSPSNSILVELSTTPDQGSECAYATWLTSEGRFYKVEAMIAYGTHGLLEIETFEHVSSEMPVSEHEPGIGKSFGALALEVLSETGRG